MPILSVLVSAWCRPTTELLIGHLPDRTTNMTVAVSAKEEVRPEELPLDVSLDKVSVAEARGACQDCDPLFLASSWLASVK